jgi:hypothetical protein
MVETDFVKGVTRQFTKGRCRLAASGGQSGGMGRAGVLHLETV